MAREHRDDRVAHLDGIRAVAILAVLALHWLSWYFPLFRGGSIGVDVFFVLSGFIITTVLWRTGTPTSVPSAWWTFVTRRVVRLYPALLGFVALTVLLYAVVPGAPVAADTVAGRGVLVLAQLSALTAAVHGHGIWTDELNPFGQTWSLAVEWYAYLLWPAVVLAARRRGLTARRLMTGTLVVAALAYAVSLPMGVRWFYFGPTARLAEILCGGALALLLMVGLDTRLASSPLLDQRGKQLRKGAAAALVFLGAYALLGPHADSPLYRYVGVPLSVLATVVLILVGYAGHGGATYRLLAHDWMAGLGRHSYSLYLWHMVPLLLLQQATSVPKPLLGLATVAVTAALTLLSYRFLERPFLRPRSSELRLGAASSSAGSAGSVPEAQDTPRTERGDQVVG